MKPYAVPIKDIGGLSPLGPLELQVLMIIWKREEAGHEAMLVWDCVNEINASITTVAYTTILTIFQHLHDKKWLKLVGKVDKAFSYRSARSRREVGQEGGACFCQDIQAIIPKPPVKAG